MLQSEGMTEQVLHSIIEEATVSIWIVDEDDCIRYVNPAGLELTGYAAGALLGQPFAMLMDDAMAAQHRAHLKSYARRGGPSDILGQVREFQLKIRSGEMIDIELKAFPLEGASNGKKLFAGLISDIRDRKTLEAQLRQRATHDALTGCLNRAGFFQIARREFERGGVRSHPLGVLLLDVDHFKRINDDHGHQVGDRVLKVLVHELEAGLRDEDLLGRYGGEEFIVLLPGVDESRLLQVAERLRRRVEAIRVPLGEHVVSLTISLGGALRRKDDDIDRIIGRADRGLYLAKQTGRNRSIIEGGPETAD